MRIASFYGLMECDLRRRPHLGADDAGLLALRGQGRPERVLVDVARAPISPSRRSFVWGDLRRHPVQTPRRRTTTSLPAASTVPILGDPGSSFLWAGGRLADAWPASPNEDEYSSMRTSNVETLVIGGSLDFATPPQVATNELLPYLPNGHQVVLQGFGHTTDFWTHQNAAGSRLINTFFDKGQVDDSLYKPMHVDFTPSLSQTVLGKGIAATMVGLGLIAVLSLGSRHGYWAWVHRDWSAETKLVGLRRRPRLAGAWLGLHAAGGLLALVTAIAGAVAGANLTLILLDMSRARSLSRPAPSGMTTPLQEAELEPMVSTH